MSKPQYYHRGLFCMDYSSTTILRYVSELTQKMMFQDIGQSFG